MKLLALSASFVLLVVTPVMADPCTAIPDRGPKPAWIKEGATFAGPVRCERPTITDGDTLVCSGQRIRLWGVNAVERGHPGYAEASAHLGKLTVGTVKCEPKYRDRYGRYVSMCYSSGVDIGGQMVRDGFAADWPKYSGGYYGK